MVEIIEEEKFPVNGKLGKVVSDKAEISNLTIHHHVQTDPVCFVKEMCT